MSSRRSFLGAAAAALTLPTAAAEPDPDASNPGGEADDHRSGSSPARVTARTTVNRADGSVSVRSIRYVRDEADDAEAELVLAAPPLRFAFTLDREATRQLRETLVDDRGEGHVGGSARLFSDVTGEAAEASLAVLGERLQITTADTEAAVVE